MAVEEEFQMMQQPIQSESIPEWVAKNLIEYIENNEATTLVLIVLLIVSAAYGLLTITKNILGYRLSNEDLKTKRLKNVSHLHKARDKHDEMSEINALCLFQLIAEFEKDSEIEELNSLRENAIHFYTQKYLPSLEKYLDIFEIYHNKKQRRNFLKEVVRKELLMAVEFRETINSKLILEILGRAPLPLDRNSYCRIWSFWRNSMTWVSYKLRKELNVEIAKWPINRGD